jgi:hypothetical protein
LQSPRILLAAAEDIDRATEVSTFTKVRECPPSRSS